MDYLPVRKARDHMVRNRLATLLMAGTASIIALTITACHVVPYAERHPDIRMLRVEPDCEFEVLGRIEAEDGHEPVFGQSKDWDTRANMEQVEAELRAEAAKLGAPRLVIQERRMIPNESGGYRHIDLRGIAISNCR